MKSSPDPPKKLQLASSQPKKSFPEQGVGHPAQVRFDVLRKGHRALC